MESTNDITSDNHDEITTPNTSENETIETWTFLGDESTNSIHKDTSGNTVDHHDEDTKLSTKTSRSSSSCLS